MVLDGEKQGQKINKTCPDSPSWPLSEAQLPFFTPEPFPSCISFPRGAGDGRWELWAAHDSSSRPLLPLHTTPLLRHGLPRGCRGVSAPVPAASPALLLLPPGRSQGWRCLPSQLGAILPFHTRVPRGAIALAAGLGWALRWGGWSRWCVAQGSPGLSSQRPPAHAWHGHTFPQETSITLTPCFTTFLVTFSVFLLLTLLF